MFSLLSSFLLLFLNQIIYLFSPATATFLLSNQPPSTSWGLLPSKYRGRTFWQDLSLISHCIELYDSLNKKKKKRKDLYMPRRPFKKTVLIMSMFTINKASLIVNLELPGGIAKNRVLLYNAANMLNCLGPHLLPSDLFSTSCLFCSEQHHNYLSLNNQCV